MAAKELLVVAGQKKEEEGKVKSVEYGSGGALAKRELDYGYGICIDV